MREFAVRDEEKWMHQNGARFTGAYAKGVLLDNYILECRRGWCAVYERYATPNSSTHVFKFAPYSDQRACDELWAEFMDFEERLHREWMEREMEHVRLRADHDIEIMRDMYTRAKARRTA